jgi:hypothetical protein
MLNFINSNSSSGTALVVLACMGSTLAAANELRIGHSFFGGHELSPRFPGAIARQTGALATVTQSVQNLLGATAREALGKNGIERLEQFARLDAGWDTPTSKPLNIASVISCARFFEETGLCPVGLSVFMSSGGNVVINWLDNSGQLVELEFDSGHIHYFLESESDEGSLPNNDLGLSQLLKILVTGDVLPTRAQLS